MSIFLNPMQAAVFNRLSAQLTGIPVYDHSPGQPDGLPESGFPYVLLGDDTHAPFDTDDSNGSSATLTIHVWSRYAGKKEAKNILGSIYTALHKQAASLTAAGFAFIDCLCEFSEVIDEIDGKTRHGVTRFRLTVEKLP